MPAGGLPADRLEPNRVLPHVMIPSFIEGDITIVLCIMQEFFQTKRKGRKARSRSAAAATKFSTTDGHGLTRIKPSRWAYSELRVRALRGEKVFSEMSNFGILHCKEL
jgi:hypothetical protein